MEVVLFFKGKVHMEMSWKEHSAFIKYLANFLRTFPNSVSGTVQCKMLITCLNDNHCSLTERTLILF